MTRLVLLSVGATLAAASVLATVMAFLLGAADEANRHRGCICWEDER